ncbi:hypothetical protein ABIA33_003603 [Streptacidiphilus sp. MAP12-16]|uniref:hypothetical protein n=1 Tax=Streptacidiphilus sp. MAP12-16 TaxID=3156300 RepID=UPI0035135F47
MTTDLPQPQTQSVEPPLGGPADESAAPAPAGRRRARSIALAAAAALVAVAAGGGIGYAVLKSQHAQPKPPAAAVAKPSPSPAYGALSDGNHFGSLSDLLLPLPAGFTLGPDDPGLGDDAVLTSAAFLQYAQSGQKGVSSSERQQLKSWLDASHVLGYAVRSFHSTDQQTYELTLLQENQGFAKVEPEADKELADYTNLFRAGPAISGFPKARCYLPPLRTGDKLDHLQCRAALGDLLVTMYVDGVAPLDRDSAAGLFQQQLTRLAIPAAQV